MENWSSWRGCRDVTGRDEKEAVIIVRDGELVLMGPPPGPVCWIPADLAAAEALAPDLAQGCASKRGAVMWLSVMVGVIR